MTESSTVDIFTPTESVEVLGLETHYRRAGSGSPLLYLGDQGYSGRWIPLFEKLAESFDVIVPDHPSFGKTDIPDGLLTFQDLVLHNAALLDAIGVGAVHLVGHGFGGWLAGEFAAVYPERVLSLTLIAPSGTRPDEGEAMFDGFRPDREKWLNLALGDDREQWAPIIDADPDGPNRVLTDYRERIGVARVAWNPRYSLALEHHLPRVTAPSQVLIPDEELLIAPSVARRFAELLSAPAPITISGTSAPTRHLLVIQEPEQVAQKIVEIAAQAS